MVDKTKSDKLATAVSVGGQVDDGGIPPEPPTKVQLERSASPPTLDEPLWIAIRNRTNAIAFERYNEFIDRVLCDSSSEGGTLGAPSLSARKSDLLNRPTIHGVDSYNLLKLATEVFLILECGVKVEAPRDPFTGQPGNADAFIPDEDARHRGPVTFREVQTALQQYLGGTNFNVLPYLDRVLNAILSTIGGDPDEVLAYCDGVLRKRRTCPSLLELIWSYWHEEGMLVQSMNAIALRFQNRRRGERDPLGNLEIDPLRPLNNILWGFVQDEQNRLSVPRRAYEYDHHYGLTLYGRAVSKLDSADSRSKFIAAFHNLLYRAAMFYREDDDTTVIADAFPLLNALREVHLILAEGAHNQFGDLPWTARKEMLIMEWILARPEMREFLRGRHMVPYQERWMGAVDDMKRLQGWSDVTVTHFRELGVFGEQILLSVRYGDWIVVNNSTQARNWARSWRPEVQRYIHAYAAATGVDLSTEITDTREAANRTLQPSVHLASRLASRAPRAALTGARVPALAAPEMAGIASPNRMLRHEPD